MLTRNKPLLAAILLLLAWTLMALVLRGRSQPRSHEQTSAIRQPY